MKGQNRLERRLIAVAAGFIGIFNIGLAMFRAPLEGIGQFRHIVPGQAIMGSGFVLLILGIVLLLTARGLWHGKRMAWLVAVACAIGSTFAHPLKNLDIWGTAGSLIFLGALIGARPQFPARSDPPGTRRGFALTLTAFAIVFVYSWAGLYLLDKDFRHSVNVIDGLSDSLRLLFILPATAAEPVSRHGSWFLESARVSFLLVFVFGVFQVLQPVVYRAVTSLAERDRVRDVLRRYADSSLAWFALEPDKSYFWSDSGNSVLAFKVVGNTAVVMGDPLGDESEFPALIDAFKLHCELDSWSYGFHQARPKYLSLYESQGLKVLKIGEEGTVDLPSFTLSGTHMKHIRATMNRFEREGYKTEVLRPPHSPEVIARLRVLSDEWLARGKRRERSFTVGFFDPEALQENEVLVARDADGKVTGFANILPSFNSSDGNFDMLRHGAEPKDISDFIYVSLVRLFQERGFERMTLGLAPLSGADDALSPGDAAVRLLYKYGGFMFRFKGLREYKAKFATDWEPRYLVYPGEAKLPGVALAVSRAGELSAGHWPSARGHRDTTGGGRRSGAKRAGRAASGARI